jgi:hypothetical protein
LTSAAGTMRAAPRTPTRRIAIPGHFRPRQPRTAHISARPAAVDSTNDSPCPSTENPSRSRRHHSSEVQRWPFQPTYCRSSPQIGQSSRSAGYRTRQVLADRKINLHSRIVGSIFRAGIFLRQQLQGAWKHRRITKATADVRPGRGCGAADASNPAARIVHPGLCLPPPARKHEAEPQ